ncbi:hypothetical protein [Micromonospora sp. CPCC 206061]|uniref:hypothetical protein n=1 Tax=Micromonospora sp. CPCC 206061 TaxID=3122410 RepID=UPI002FF2E161
MPALTLEVPGYSSMNGTYDHDFATAETRYQLTAARFDGVIVVAPHIETAYYEYTDNIEPFTLDSGRLAIRYGDRDPSVKPHRFADWDRLTRRNRPTVNGVQLLGGTIVTIAKAYLGVDRPIRAHKLGIGVHRDLDGRAVPAPDATATRVASVLAALARHWAGLPPTDLAELRTAAGRQVAAGYWADAGRALAKTREQIAALREREQLLIRERATLSALVPPEHDERTPLPPSRP